MPVVVPLGDADTTSTVEPVGGREAVPVTVAARLYPADSWVVDRGVDAGVVAGTDENERMLVERARTDPDAFALLYHRYVRRIYAYAVRRSGSHHVAEEITAITFEKALRAMPGFTWRGAGFEAWLFRIAANECAAYYRREQRSRAPRAQAAFAALAVDTAESGDPPADALPDADVEHVRRALATLRPRYQEVITLRYFADLSPDEAAAALGCSKPVLAVTLHRAIRALERAMAHDADRPEDDQ